MPNANPAAKYLYDNSINEISISIAVSAFVYFICFDIIDTKIISIWYVFFVTLIVLRASWTLFYKLYYDVFPKDKFWLSYYSICIFLTGVCWSFLIVLSLPPIDQNYSFAIKYILIGLSVLALYQYYFYPIASFLFSLPIFVVFGAHFFIIPGYINTVMGISSVIFLLMLFFLGLFGKEYSKNNFELKKDVESARDVAEQANLAKSRFLASASHDLRQPLYALTLLIELLLENVEKSDVNRPTLRSMKTSVDSLAQLLDALLDISKLDSGSITPRHEHILLQDIIRPIYTQFQLEGQAKGIRVENISENICVYTDTVLLSLVIRNVLSNAIKYTDNGLVSISSTAIEDNLILSIRDSGIGIPREYQAMIFDEFFQLNNPHRDRSKGLGLGLSIVRRLTDYMKTPLCLYSNVGKGSEFQLQIPMGNIQKINKPDDFPANNVELQGLLVWIIEDDKEVNNALFSLLTNWGCTVETFYNFETVKEQIQQGVEKPCALISD